MKILYQNVDKDIKVVIQPDNAEEIKAIGENDLKAIIEESGSLAFEFLLSHPGIKEISISSQLSLTPDEKEQTLMMENLLDMMNQKEN